MLASDKKTFRKHDAFDASFSLFHNDQFNNNSFYHFGQSSPESLFSIMAEIESSGSRTPSPKNELYENNNGSSSTVTSRDDLSPPHFLYHHKYQRKDDSIFQYDIENSTVQQLKECTETIQKLTKQINLLTSDNEMKCNTIINLQTSLSKKELEVQDQAHKISVILSQLNLYESFIKSKGLDLSELNSGEGETSEIKLNSSFDRKAVDYRKVLDKNINWDTLVDRITKDTDQQASIFMQQKLKCTLPDQRFFIFKAVLNQAYALMKNRFGNFLVQRLFESGSPDQIEALADKMRGYVLDLTCDPFGCHVVQKALDYVNESTKADLVSELLVRIPETMVHKHACHVWQKVFEIRWVHSAPPIMANIHEALNGQWAHVALDETGSLVIQNIFENLTEIEKRPILTEVLSNAVIIAKGQWGNWVIQHILEQAEMNSDREAAFEIVVREAIQLSMDQFASKVVEKALRIGGHQFMTKFIDRICNTNYSNRPRMALVDIASDQYGNYVVQWLINNATEEQKVSICRLIKRHMVSLRGSKYGQRVAFLVEKVLRNNEITTYPNRQE